MREEFGRRPRKDYTRQPLVYGLENMNLQERDSTIEGSVSVEFHVILYKGFKSRVYVGIT